MSIPSPTYDAIMAAARKRGSDDGRAAASWYFDGNTTDDTYRRTLQGLEDGDPEILDALPYPDLSGQWADEPAGPQVFADILSDADIYRGPDYEEGESLSDAYDDIFSETLDAYCDAFTEAARDDIEATARRMTGPDDTHDPTHPWNN